MISYEQLTTWQKIDHWMWHGSHDQFEMQTVQFIGPLNERRSLGISIKVFITFLAFANGMFSLGMTIHKSHNGIGRYYAYFTIWSLTFTYITMILGLLAQVLNN